MQTNCIQFLALACLLLLLPSQCLTQRLPARLESLEIEQLIKIRTVNHGLHIGRLARMSDDTLFLRPQRGSKAVGTAVIDQLWVRGTAAKKGAVIGGTLGAALGGLLFAYVSYGVCDAAHCSVDPGVTLVGLVNGGLVGAATGALLGAIGRQWHRRYP